MYYLLDLGRQFGNILLIVCGLCFLFFLGVLAFDFGYMLRRGHRRTGSLPFYKERGLFLRVFIDLPQALIYNYFSTPRDFFRPQGLIVFTGRQGSGKSIAMTEQILRWHKQFPAAYIYSNYGLSVENESIDNYFPLTQASNGFQGVIVGLDELQNWFASSKNRDFPVEMLTVITQNRKNRRVILGTSQVFVRLAKPLREQVTEIRKCFTLFGCVTFVSRFAPCLDDKGEVAELKHLGFYWFPHSLELRTSYDTWAVVEKMSVG